MNKSFEGRLGRHLYETRDIEGNQSGEAVRFVHDLHRALEDIPEFIGIDLYGSSVKGYANQYSDIDIRILMEASNKDISIKMEANKRCRALKDQYNYGEGNNNEKIQHEYYWIDENLISSVMKSDRYNARKVGPLMPLFRKITGERIENIRNSIRSEFEQQSSERKKEFITAIVNSIHFFDWDMSILDENEKMDERVGGVPAYLGEKRKEMWERRVKSILNFSGE